MGSKKKTVAEDDLVPTRTFSDYTGLYDVASLFAWVAENQERVVELEVAHFLGVLTSDTWSDPSDDPISNVQVLLQDPIQRERVLSSDLTQPIIVKADGTVIDGLHRIFKAIHGSVGTLPAVLIDQSELDAFLIGDRKLVPVSGEDLPIPDRYIQLPGDRLPDDEERRRDVIEEYFSDQLPSVSKNESGWLVCLERPQERYGCYMHDPTLSVGLEWWKPGTRVCDIPIEYRLWDKGLMAIEDQWMPYSWSQYFSRNGVIPEEIVLIHLDDHQDMMRPRIGTRLDGGLYDLITGNSIDMLRPETIEAAILSGAIGKGSILLPLIWSVRTIHVRHLAFRPHPNTYYMLRRNTFPDGLLSKRDNRIGLTLEPTHKGKIAEGSSYVVSPDPDICFADIPAGVPILFHVDMDCFNDRFDGNSNWQEENARVHDLSEDEQVAFVKMIIQRLAEKGLLARIVDTSIGLSPSFFPGEYWRRVTETLIDELRRAGVNVS